MTSGIQPFSLFFHKCGILFASCEPRIGLQAPGAVLQEVIKFNTQDQAEQEEGPYSTHRRPEESKGLVNILVRQLISISGGCMSASGER